MKNKKEVYTKTIEQDYMNPDDILVEDIIVNSKDMSQKSNIYLYKSDRSTELILKKGSVNYPELDTVLIVERFVKKYSGKYNKSEFWKRLPKQMSYQTFKIIFDYLTESGKIAKDLEGKICWIWNPELVRKYLMDDSLNIKV
jgi:hypothetical protein